MEDWKLSLVIVIPIVHLTIGCCCACGGMLYHQWSFRRLRIDPRYGEGNLMWTIGFIFLPVMWPILVIVLPCAYLWVDIVPKIIDVIGSRVDRKKEETRIANELDTQNTSEKISGPRVHDLDILGRLPQKP